MHRPRLGFSLLKVPEYFPHLILIFILIFKCERNAAANINLRLGQVKRQCAPRAAPIAAGAFAE